MDLVTTLDAESRELPHGTRPLRWGPWATLGWGVLLTIPLILVYQGGLALGASVFSGLLSELQLREMSAVGGLLIIGVGLKLLSIRDVKVADYLPAILLAPLLVAAVVRIKEALAL